jgi:hypothetical protein
MDHGNADFLPGVSEKIPNVHHHNYYLGSNFKEYANKIFTNPDSFEKPYYYVNVLVALQSRLCAGRVRKPLFCLSGARFKVQNTTGTTAKRS